MNKKTIWEIFGMTKEHFEEVFNRADVIRKITPNRFAALELAIEEFEGMDRALAVGVIEFYYGGMAMIKELVETASSRISYEDKEVF